MSVPPILPVDADFLRACSDTTKDNEHPTTLKGAIMSNTTDDNNGTHGTQNPNGTMRMSILHQCIMPRFDELGTAQPTDPSYTARFIITDPYDIHTSVTFTVYGHQTPQEATLALAEKLRNCARLIDIATKKLEQS